MATRVWIGLFTLGAAYWAIEERDLAALYVALGACAIVYLLHAIEVKINRLLDERGIRVWDKDIARE